MTLKKVEDILPAINDALAKEIPVYVTDGTTTRVVCGISYDRDFYNSYGFLDVRFEANGTEYVADIKTAMFDELVEWGVKRYKDGWYIAPDWWHEL